MGTGLKYRQKYVECYLSRTFMVRDENVYDEDGGKCWGYQVVDEITNVFGFDREFVTDVVRYWVEARGIKWDDWTLPKILKATWSSELAQDLTSFFNIDAEAELTRMLSEEISKEINCEIIKNVTNLVQLETRLSQLGYEKGPVIYDPMNFAPKRRFIRP